VGRSLHRGPQLRLRGAAGAGLALGAVVEAPSGPVGEVDVVVLGELAQDVLPDQLLGDAAFARLAQVPDRQQDAVVGDASMLPADEIEEVFAEMVRVAKPEGRVVLKLTTHGSFGEFFSIYWEALHEAGIDNDVWTALERLINERRTISDGELMAERVGLRNVESFVSKEEFDYETAGEFLESPLIRDCFLSDWLEIVPEESRDEVRRQIVSIIERERHNAPFDVSIKAAVIAGVK